MLDVFLALALINGVSGKDLERTYLKQGSLNTFEASQPKSLLSAGNQSSANGIFKNGVYSII